MVRPGRLTVMTFSVVPVSAGRAPLGSWGTLELAGSTSAVLRLTMAEDLELPEAVAVDLTGGVLLLNEDIGRLLFLPYAGEVAVTYALDDGAQAFPTVKLPRDPDIGLRMAVVRLLPGLGAVHLTEGSLALFGEDGSLAWRHEEDFAGWTIEGTTLDEMQLLWGDWEGRESRQRRAVIDGTRLD